MLDLGGAPGSQLQPWPSPRLLWTLGERTYRWHISVSASLPPSVSQINTYNANSYVKDPLSRGKAKVLNYPCRGEPDLELAVSSFLLWSEQFLSFLSVSPSRDRWDQMVPGDRPRAVPEEYQAR